VGKKFHCKTKKNHWNKYGEKIVIVLV
jgi:hypothetical protein